MHVVDLNKVILVRDFYRDLNQGERSQIRVSMQDDVADLREDLARDRVMDLSDPETVRLITDSGIFTGDRLIEVIRA